MKKKEEEQNKVEDQKEDGEGERTNN